MLTKKEVQCGYCGNCFLVDEYVYKQRMKRKQKNFYCSACRSGSKANKPELRFWAKVDRTGGENSCWIWRGSKDSGGYGSFRLGKKNVKAHRFAYELSNGVGSLDGLDGCHRCDNPECVNPDHIVPGDHSYNMNDMVAKKRHRDMAGENNVRARLTESEAKMIYEMATSGNTLKTTADKFGVSISTVFGIKRKITWKHIYNKEDKNDI